VYFKHDFDSVINFKVLLIDIKKGES